MKLVTVQAHYTHLFLIMLRIWKYGFTILIHKYSPSSYRWLAYADKTLCPTKQSAGGGSLRIARIFLHFMQWWGSGSQRCVPMFLGLPNPHPDPSQVRIRIRRLRMFLSLPDPHPDSFCRDTDPRIRIRIQIHTKMTRIPNTDFMDKKKFHFSEHHLRL